MADGKNGGLKIKWGTKNKVVGWNKKWTEFQS